MVLAGTPEGNDQPDLVGIRTWRELADWTSRAIFVVAVIVGWIAIGPPWSPKDANATGLLDSGLVPVGAFIAAALTQRVFVANYAIKAGPIELPALEEVNEGLDAQQRIIETLKAQLGHMRGQRDAALASAKAALETVTAGKGQ